MGRKIAGTSGTNTSRHLRWEIFEKRIGERIPSLEPIKGTPRVELFIATGGSPIGARFYTSEGGSLSSPLAEVTIRQIGRGKNTVLEVSTGNQSLFRDFYTLCCAIADRVQIDHEPVESALTETLRSWSKLLRRRSLLSSEAQVGVLGELLFLRRIARSCGWVFAANSWQGPKSEEHDFTLSSVDAEVKSTRSERRLHEISSLTQLVPKLNRKLFVLSIQLTQGSGQSSFTLPQLVGEVLSSSGASSPRAADRVRLLLDSFGWADEDSPHYESSYHLRAPIAAIPVDKHFPAIVPQTLVGLGESLSRIKQVGYSVVLDGLSGVHDGSRKFERLFFPKVTVS